MALPDPFVDSDCDCRDLDGFMLNTERLMASELVALSTHEEIAAALFLWCRAWKQIPAASLPDDERVLAAFAKMPLPRFRKIRGAVMRGFEKCSDGRLYHRFLAEEAMRAFAKKEAFQRKRDGDSERLRNWRVKRKGSQTETVQETHDETRFVAEGQGQGQGQGHIPSSLRSDGHDVPLHEPDDGRLPLSEPPATPKPIDPKAHAWAEARRIGRGHLGTNPGAFIGRLYRDLGDDHDALLALFKAAEREQPGHWPSWLTAAAKARRSGGGGFSAYDPVEVWTRPPIKAELGSKGSDIGHALVGNGVIDVCAQCLLDDARLPDTPRTDWAILAAWLRDGLDYSDTIQPVIRRIASRPDYTPPGGLKFFDQAVRAAAGPMPRMVGAA